MKRLFWSCFGLGRLPVAPGTWGSLPPALCYAVLCHFNAAPAVSIVVMTVLLLLGSVVCIVTADAAVEAAGTSDPGEMVADEVAGQSLTFLVASAAAGGMPPVAAAAGFVFFRVADVLKPWPCRILERLPGAWGILADDLFAGLYAGTALAAGAMAVRFW